MAKFKELRLRIEGKINGQDMTPLTIPMAHLLEYLTDLAAIMGYKDAVHFIRVADGSTTPVLLIDEEEENRIKYRMRMAQKGQAQREANLAYVRFDQRLRQDEGIAQLIDGDASIFEFPGRNLQVPKAYGPISESGSLTGRLVRVGGLDASIPVWLLRADDELFCCEASELICQQLAPFLFKHVRVHGIATWTRSEEEKWKLERFRIQSFDPEALSDESLTFAVGRLRSIPDNGWANVEDPLEELRRIRHGEDEATQ